MLLFSLLSGRGDGSLCRLRIGGDAASPDRQQPAEHKILRMTRSESSLAKRASGERRERPKSVLLRG